MDNDQRAQIIEIWKVIVEVQRHFNDISMRIRSMFVTILLALFASIGFLIDKKLSLEVSIVKVQFATLIPLFGCFGAYLFYFIDRYWYHRLLVGSVRHGMSIEETHKVELPELSLTAAIGAESPFTPTGPARWLACLVVSHKKFRETGQLHSAGKIEFFYKSVVVVLVLTTILLGWLGGVSIETSPLTPSSAATATAPATAPPVAPAVPVSPAQAAPATLPKNPVVPVAPAPASPAALPPPATPANPATSAPAN